jgi:hypothetical protein
MGNGGLWEVKPLKITQDKEKTWIKYSSYSLPIDHNSLVPIFRDMHYCLLVSPFHTLEWIYVDSQYAQSGYTPPVSVFLN